MGVEQERFGGGFVPPWIVHEHHARYAHAAQYVRGLAVLDCACGTGLGSRTFMASGPSRLIAVDLSVGALREAARRAPGARFVCGSATAIPVASRTVDLVVSLETIEHLEDDQAYLDEVARVLRPGGRFVCSTPNRSVTNPGAALSDKPFNRFHVREYAEDEFRALLAARFEGLELFGQNPCSRARVSVAAQVGKMIGSRAAARGLQLLKLPRVLRDLPERYVVQSPVPGFHFEYLLAVCRSRS